MLSGTALSDHASPSTALESALHKISIGIVVFNESREVLFCNKRYAEIYGLSSNQVRPGTPVGHLIRRRLELGLKVPSDTNDYVCERTQGRFVATSALQELADGRIIAYSVCPLEDGGGIATHEEVTEREELHANLTAQHQLSREQEEQLRVRNVRFDLALNNMSQGLCFFDGSEPLIVCNKRYTEMYRLDPAVIRPSITLREIVDLRFAAGTFPAMSKEEYLKWREAIAIFDTPSDTVVQCDREIAPLRAAS